MTDGRHGAESTQQDRPGPPLVLLPGMNCSDRLWSGLEPSSTIRPILTEPTLAGQVERLLDELPSRFALAGLSLGGIVAMALVRSAPERVDRLGLMSTNPHPPTVEQRHQWMRERERLATGATARDLQRDLLPLLLSATTLRHCPELVEETLEMADDVGEENLDRQLRLQATRVDERPGLRAVRCPTLVIAARHDRLCGVERHEEIAAIIPAARLRVLDDAAHLSPLERPAEVAELLAEWLTAEAPWSL